MRGVAAHENGTCVHSDDRITCFGSDFDAGGALVEIDVPPGKPLRHLAFDEKRMCVSREGVVSCLFRERAKWIEVPFKEMHAPEQLVVSGEELCSRHGHVWTCLAATSNDWFGEPRARPLPWSHCTVGMASRYHELSCFPEESRRPADEHVSIVMGPRHACELKKGGKILCWGADEHGQAGASPRWTPTPGTYEVAAIEDAVQVAVGGEHTCALREGGEVVCWGRLSPSLSPGVHLARQSRFQRIVAASTGSSDSHLAALREDGVVLVMHYFGGFEEVKLPARAVQLAGHDRAGSAVRLENGEVYRLRGGSEPVRILAEGAVLLFDRLPCALMQDHTARCWGGADWGVLGPRVRDSSGEAIALPKPDPVKVLFDVGLARCGVSSAGAIDCWGTPRYHWHDLNGPSRWTRNHTPQWGQVPDAPETMRLRTRVVVVGGDERGCLIDDRGHVQVVVDDCKKTRCSLEVLKVPSLSDVVRTIPGSGCAVETKTGEAFAIDVDRPVWSGDPTTFEPFTVSPISLRRMGSISRYSDGCFLTKTGQMYCGLHASKPVEVPAVTDFANQGDRPRCAALRDGGLTCWSDSAFARLEGRMDPLEGHLPKRLFDEPKGR